MRWILRIGVAFAGAAMLMLFVLWALLQSALFGEWRKNFVENLLEQQAGFPVTIEGGTRASIGRVITIEILDGYVQSESLPETRLIELQRLSLSVDPVKALRGEVDFDNLEVAGLFVNFVRSPDDLTSWESPSIGVARTAEASDTAAPVARFFKAHQLLRFVLERSDSFETVRILVDDQLSGFRFEYHLAALDFIRSEGDQRLQIMGEGTINDERFEWTSDQRIGGPFSTRASFGDLTLRFDGVDRPGVGAGYSGDVVLSTGDIGDILDVLRLNRAMEGTGALTMRLENDGDATRISDLDTHVEFASGNRFGARGSIEDAVKGLGLDIEVTGRFHPEKDPPDHALRLADLRIKQASARILGDRANITLDDARIQTNAFEQNLNDIGPISVGAIRRTPQGTLQLADMIVALGPEDAPAIVVTGSIDDVLNLKDFDLQGRVDAPMKLLLADLQQADVERFGRVQGAFAFNDRQGSPALDGFTLTSVDTDLWQLDVSASGTDVDSLDAQVRTTVRVDDSVDFMTALGLKPVDVAPLAASLEWYANASGFDLAAAFEAGSSQVDADVTWRILEPVGKLTGTVESEEVLLADLQKLISVVQESQNLHLVTAGGPQEASVDVQPLVLEVRETTLEDLLNEVGVQPLVLDNKGLAGAEMTDADNILRQNDIDIGIEIKKITGVQGVTSLSTRLVSEQGRARLGPVDVSYGGGRATVEAAVNVVDAPDVLTVTGSLNGWNIANLLRSTGAGVAAQGTVSGVFNLTGRNDSARQFVNSMYGPVDLSLSNGKLSSSLLELAGLGVVRWLFSQERRQGETDITCLKAPLQIRAGEVRFDQVVAETTRVQTVARGDMNWRKDRINMRVETRPIGQPLSRSAWPVDVSGALSAPQVKPQIGGSRSRRADGADVMPANRKPCVPDILQLQQR